MVDVAIAGGGPSGIAAAVTIKQLAPELDVVILERNDAVGRKLRATGNGRCNIANTGYESYAEVSEFLARCGIAFRVYENGLVYPYSESAADVTDRFIELLDELGVKVRTGYEVKTAEKCDSGFVINGKLKCRNLVLALGGKAGPAFGCLGDGYRLARGFGHSMVTPVPILTPVEIKGFDKLGLSGIRAKGTASLLKDGMEVFCEAGEVQFTKYGLSGICIFNMTRHMRYAKGEGLSRFEISLNFDFEGSLEGFVRGRIEDARSRCAGACVSVNVDAGSGAREGRAEQLLLTAYRPALATEILRQANVPAEKLISVLGESEIEAIVKASKDLRFKPDNIRGWKDAQCTMGGVSLEEIDEASSESKLAPGLYITGELMDYDGPCGGFNLCNAWLTGIKAGRSIANDALQN